MFDCVYPTQGPWRVHHQDGVHAAVWQAYWQAGGVEWVGLRKVSFVIFPGFSSFQEKWPGQGRQAVQGGVLDDDEKQEIDSSIFSSLLIMSDKKINNF